MVTRGLASKVCLGPAILSLLPTADARPLDSCDDRCDARGPASASSAGPVTLTGLKYTGNWDQNM